MFSNQIVLTFALLLLAISDRGDRSEAVELDPENPNDPLREWKMVRESLDSSREAMCSFLLVQVSDEEEALKLDKVVGLFEQALDHMAKSTEFTERFRKIVGEKLIRDYDKSGGATVLEISEARRSLIRDYKAASESGSSPEVLRQILDKYFYIACAQKLATVIAEKSMYETATKIDLMKENRKKSKLSFSKTQQQQQP